MLSPLGIPGNMKDALDTPGLGAAIHEYLSPWFGQCLYDSETGEHYDGEGRVLTDHDRERIQIQWAQRRVDGVDKLEMLADRCERDIRPDRTAERPRPEGSPLGTPAGDRKAASGLGVHPNNMHPPFSHECENDSGKGPGAVSESEYLQWIRSLPQGGGGIDWFEATGYGTWDGRNREKWDKVQEYAQQNGNEWSAIELAPGNPNSIGVLFMHGVGKGFSRQPYVVKYDGITVAFGAVTDGQGSPRPTCFVRATGSAFLSYGEGGVLNRVARMLRWLGLDCEFKMSRIDFCVDLPHVSVNEFVKSWDQGRGIVTKARDCDLHFVNGECSGLTVKSSAVMCRIYNKQLEVLTQSPDKLEDMMRKRWGGYPTHATRVEFQVRLSKIARERKPENITDCIRHAWRLFSWLSVKWFRLTTGITDRTHTSRSQVAPCWALMFMVAETVFARLDQPLPEHAPAEVSKAALLAQFFGLAATLMSHTQHAHPETFFLEVMRDHMYSSKYYNKLESRFAERGVSLREFERSLCRDDDVSFNPEEYEV